MSDVLMGILSVVAVCATLIYIGYRIPLRNKIIPWSSDDKFIQCYFEDVGIKYNQIRGPKSTKEIYIKSPLPVDLDIFLEAVQVFNGLPYHEIEIYATVPDEIKREKKINRLERELVKLREAPHE